jgi:hypothetical protein
MAVIFRFYEWNCDSKRFFGTIMRNRMTLLSGQPLSLREIAAYRPRASAPVRSLSRAWVALNLDASRAVGVRPGWPE